MPELIITVPKPLPFSRAMRAVDAARYLDVTPGRITKMIDAGRFKSTKIGNAIWIDLEGILAYRADQVARRSEEKK